ncbi:GNAT family N-acetyltransferase [Pseudonocardia bannensis]|uniref:GNAT family N-acetyltransferase n=1 Tax=Pseudonocardia bannensis TaxID=630973 RepID=A0A848DPX4_9PSEU|nr:GNAT family N-acetyltransferase [Pseudonocardia bannensis]NMH94900.1 GNAT family N-acetyltransferase [Pseudonocardia bannensis]
MTSTPARTLLHLCTTADWAAARAAGELAPPSLADAGFVHLSTCRQVTLPADRIFRGRDDVLLLAIDPDALTGAGVPVRWEPGLPTDPPELRFPHAYGAVPVTAVIAVLPYRPRPDGGFDEPALLPAAADTALRAAVLEPSLLRRVATREVPVLGGVAVLTAAVPGSRQHNQLLITEAVSAADVAAEADRVLGGAGLAHRRAMLTGRGCAAAAGLGERGWGIERLVTMAAPAGGGASGRVEQVDLETLQPAWVAMWRRELHGVSDTDVAQLVDRYRLEEPEIDLRYLAVRDGGAVVSSCLLKIDGGTAMLDEVTTDPAHRGRGHGDALVQDARAIAGRAGCDLVVLDAAADDWPRHWYARRGFAEVGERATASRDAAPPPIG